MTAARRRPKLTGVTPQELDPQELDGPRSRIRDVLLNDWDPHDAARSEAATRAYDGYVEPLHALLESGAGEDAVVEFLHERERESMCFPSLGTQRLRRVARKLLDVRPNRSGHGGEP